MQPHLVRLAGMTIGACVLIFSLSSCAQQSSDLDTVRSEVQRRRALRETANEASGVARMPLEVNTAGLVKMGIKDVPISGVAQLLATASQKEVLVSGHVAKRRISVPEGTRSSAELVAAIQLEVAKHNVKIVSVSPDTLVLVDAQ